MGCRKFWGHLRILPITADIRQLPSWSIWATASCPLTKDGDLLDAEWSLTNSRVLRRKESLINVLLIFSCEKWWEEFRENWLIFLFVEEEIKCQCVAQRCKLRTTVGLLQRGRLQLGWQLWQTLWCFPHTQLLPCVSRSSWSYTVPVSSSGQWNARRRVGCDFQAEGVNAHDSPVPPVPIKEVFHHVTSQEVVQACQLVSKRKHVSRLLKPLPSHPFSLMKDLRQCTCCSFKPLRLVNL